MKGNINISKDLSAHAARRHQTLNPLPRWRVVFVALVLAFAFGSVSQTAPVQAQDDQVNYQFVIDIANPSSKFLCIGESREYRVRILEKALILPNEPTINASVTLAGKTSITGNIENPSVADFTSLNPVLINSPSARGLRPGAVTFTVKGKTAGDATLSFSGGVEYYNHMTIAYPLTGLPLKVINCKYKVHMDSKWSTGMTITATLDGVMQADENGAYHGTADVTWVTSKLCGIVSPISPSTAEMTGALNGDDQLVVKITFGSARSSGGGVCVKGVTTKNYISPDPLIITVRQAGVVKQTEVATAENGSFPGQATVTVTPLQK